MTGDVGYDWAHRKVNCWRSDDGWVVWWPTGGVCGPSPCVCGSTAVPTWDEALGVIRERVGVLTDLAEVSIPGVATDPGCSTRATPLATAS